MNETIQKIAEALGIDVKSYSNDADILNAILEAINELKSSITKQAEAEAQLKAKDLEKSELAERIAKIEKEKAELEKTVKELKLKEDRMRYEGLIDTSGKVNPANRERLITFALKYGEEELKAYLDMLPPLPEPPEMKLRDSVGVEIGQEPKTVDDIIRLAKEMMAKDKSLTLKEAVDKINEMYNLKK